MSIKKNIYFYDPNDENGFLANFSWHAIVVDGVQYKTVEHYYQAQKFLGTKTFQKIVDAPTPFAAKALAKKYKALRVSRWGSIKDDVMYRGVLAKFKQHKDLQRLLLETGEIGIIEDAQDDSYWGQGADGKGENKAGKVLEKVRREIAFSLELSSSTLTEEQFSRFASQISTEKYIGLQHYKPTWVPIKIGHATRHFLKLSYQSVNSIGETKTHHVFVYDESYQSKNDIMGWLSESTMNQLSSFLLQKNTVAVRVQSSCINGDNHAQNCDCGQQKDAAYKEIIKNGRGVMIILDQEGRNVGSIGKDAVNLHEELANKSTFEAFSDLGYGQSDYRNYEIVAPILKDFGVASVRLITNNPAKSNVVGNIAVEEFVRLPVIKNDYNQHYTDAKKRIGHKIIFKDMTSLARLRRVSIAASILLGALFVGRGIFEYFNKKEKDTFLELKEHFEKREYDSPIKTKNPDALIGLMVNAPVGQAENINVPHVNSYQKGSWYYLEEKIAGYSVFEKNGASYVLFHSNLLEK